MPDDADAPPLPDEQIVPQQAAEDTPVGFWAELVAAIRQEMKPPLTGYFTTGENATVRGVLRGDQVILCCNNKFVLDIVNKPEVLDLTARKASAILKRAVTVRAEDASAKAQTSEKMERLMNFGRSHSNIVNIKDN